MAKDYVKLREELKSYYLNQADERGKAFYEKLFPMLDETYREGMSVFEMKVMQYRMITKEFDPVLFLNSPFYYELGTMAAQCDGARSFRGHRHAGGWVFKKNEHIFKDQDPELYDKRKVQGHEKLYNICGTYNDASQHFLYYFRPVLSIGLKGIYEKAAERLKTAETPEQKEFLEAVCEGLLCIKKISEKFAAKAEILASLTQNKKEKENMLIIASSAKRTPWEAPQSFYEALNTHAFLRKAIGALEGVGLSSFGRLDMDLYPFYQKDIAQGKLTPEEAYDLISMFLITFDMHYDHDMKMVGYSDHELENTYVIGGCDAQGNPLFNELTEMFLRATREEKIIYPKIKCRFSKDSPKEYFDAMDEAVIKGTSTILYQNDDACIPAFVRAGRPIEEARDYIVSGCWDMNCYGVENSDGGGYVNLLKAFEFSIHNRTDKMEAVGIDFKPIDDAKSFEEVYQITCENMNALFKERAEITRRGAHVWHKVDVLPIFSSGFDACIERAADFTEKGAKYNDDHYLCLGFPNIIDSLIAIKTLCFDTKKYKLSELLAAVRNNWEGCEIMQCDAMRCCGWGDGSRESNALAARFNADLFKMVDALEATHEGGKVRLGHLTYTEIRWWGEETLATPDGRKNGDYFSQGLTPSRLKYIPSANSVVNSLARLDGSMMAGNTVVNIILPSDKMTLDICEAFLRTVADSAMQSLQLNCTTKKQLLDAQKHPEKYPDLIVRVTGFSAKFTSLSPDWQKEVLSRNFYE